MCIVLRARSLQNMGLVAIWIFQLEIVEHHFVMPLGLGGNKMTVQYYCSTGGNVRIGSRSEHDSRDLRASEPQPPAAACSVRSHNLLRPILHSRSEFSILLRQVKTLRVFLKEP